MAIAPPRGLEGTDQELSLSPSFLGGPSLLAEVSNEERRRRGCFASTSRAEVRPAACSDAGSLGPLFVATALAHKLHVSILSTLVCGLQP